jgi:hypothetical protein
MGNVHGEKRRQGKGMWPQYNGKIDTKLDWMASSYLLL